jgi:hypothetical protein
MDSQKLLKNPPLLHGRSDALTTWKLRDEVLEFIDQGINEQSRTLETGSGVSTILFAMKEAQHICITPLREEIERIKGFCAQHGISLHHITFLCHRSEVALPRLELADLDLVLIDGCHGFPVPFIDWYYTAQALRVGGTVIIDNTNLWPCRALIRCLRREPEWRLEREFRPLFASHTAVITKLRPWRPRNVVPRGKLTRVWNTFACKTHNAMSFVLKGQFNTVARKIVKQFRG